MYKRIVVIPVLTIVVILILMVSIILLPPIQHAGSGAAMSIFTDDEENSIFLPLVSKKPWPDLCYAPGTKYYQPPEIDIPEITLQHGTAITVTSTADTINGDITSVSGLLSNPGPDGIALREAISATNNDPGEYTITFSPALDGSTIHTGADNQDLPPLLGGSVIINGDIDGDKNPDITISNLSSFYPFGLTIKSSNNTIHAVELVGYFQGIFIDPTDITGTTYTNITVSNIVVRDTLVGINLHAGGPHEDTWSSYNHWENIVVINNELNVQQDGITFNLNNTIGNQLDNVIVANNNIHITQDVDSASFGVQFMAGFWVGSNDNTMTNITVTHNTILGNPDQAIAFLSGAVAGSSNVIDSLLILENEILIHDSNFAIEAGKIGINLISGDGASDYIDPDYDPIIYPEDNIIRNVDIIGNTIEGFDGRGIFLAGGCCGARNNTIENVIILNNQIRSLIPDVEFDVTGILVRSGDSRSDHHTTENLISNIIIQNNAFHLGEQATLPDTNFAAAAISVNGAGGGPGADQNKVRDIWISLNQIDSVVPGIHLNGAWEGSTENVVDTAHIYCNTIDNEPIYPHWDPPFKGIVLTGAMRDSTLNRVENVTLFYNDVARIWNDLTVILNIMDTAIDNVVEYQIIP